MSDRNEMNLAALHDRRLHEAEIGLAKQSIPERHEFPGWKCPTCGAWDSGTVMPRRAQWCDGACSHPKVAMEPVTFVLADAADRTPREVTARADVARVEHLQQQMGDEA